MERKPYPSDLTDSQRRLIAPLIPDAKPGGTGPNADNDNFKIIIRGDKDMTYKTLEPVLIACMEANVKDVNFNTYKP